MRGSNVQMDVKLRPQRPWNNCNAFVTYKNSKRLFRAALRKAFDEFESSTARRLEKEIDIDQKHAWTILNRRKKKSSGCMSLKKDGILYTDSDDICDIWYEHFCTVFSPTNYKDCNRQNEISEKVKAIRNSATKDTSANWITFEFSEVHDICNKLKCNKACGHDDIAYEHLRFGGKLLMKHLCYLFNLILQYAYVPKEWHKSMIILLYKGDNKSRTDTNSYRGISLVPSITKVFEKLTDIKLSSIRTDFPNGQQVAYQKLLSSLNASFNLQEVTLHHIEKNGTIYIVLLDSTKAFDTVPHDGLRLKLHEYGAHGKLWLLLDSMYTNLYGAVSSNGKLSKWFELKRGIRQGSSLSAKLYLIFINDLINELESSKEGAFFHDLNASSPVQADDIAIIATNCVSTQRMVTISKSKLLQFGKRRTSTPTYLYQEPINYVTSARHIGIQLDTSLKTMDRTLKACRTLRSTTTSVIRLGIHPAIVNPIVCAKIIRQLCYPKALYGCELWGKLTCTEILMLERTHHYICKFIQGLPRRTRSDMCVSLLGWLSIESFICERKLLFFGRTCRLPYSAVSFRILLRRLIDARYNQYDTRSGFACDIIEILTKYGLSKYLDQFLNDGQFPSSAIWKSVVKTSIYQVEVVKWHHRMAVDPDFVVFKDIHSFCVPHAAWRVALRHPLMRRQAHFVTSTCCLIRENLQNNRILCDKCGKLF
ncbi:unnamed protein product [Mytilus edulis]|uniref:Reverse transcriptase domain-containing protein n=1 Tax=Mytilus edulis TaxID=6550 RepID=A0A8S3SJV8_MYTED|nr:unnamed protein product [Mytilus edulis]